jgi:hypothetical protein
MNPTDRNYRDLLGAPPLPRRRQLVEDLDRLYQAPRPLPSLDTAVMQAVHDAARRAPQRAVRWGRPVWRRVAATLAATVLVCSALLAFMQHNQGATPASAQTVLRQAANAFANPAPDEATHLTYQVMVQGAFGEQIPRLIATMDIWMKAGAPGTPVVLAETDTDWEANGSVDTINRRLMQGQRGQAYTYTAGNNTVTVRTVSGVQQGPLGFDLTSIIAYFSTAADGPHQQIQSLPRRLLDGVPVDVVRVAPTADQPQLTLSFNSQTYLLREMEFALDGHTAVGQLTTDVTMPVSAVPPHTFDLNLPVGARVVQVAPPAPSSTTGPAVDLRALAPLQLLPAVCHTTAAAVTAAAQSGGKSPLAICQAIDPGVTAARLTTALTNATKAQLDAAVTRGMLTTGQAATILANETVKLNVWITAPLMS